MTRSTRPGINTATPSAHRAHPTGHTSGLGLTIPRTIARATFIGDCRTSSRCGLGNRHPPLFCATSKNSVLVPIGCTLVTPIFSGANSTRSASAIPTCANFVAAYAPKYGSPRRPAADVTIITCPRQPSRGSCLAITGTA